MYQNISLFSLICSLNKFIFSALCIWWTLHFPHLLNVTPNESISNQLMFSNNWTQNEGVNCLRFTFWLHFWCLLQDFRQIQGIKNLKLYWYLFHYAPSYYLFTKELKNYDYCEFRLIMSSCSCYENFESPNGSVSLFSLNYLSFDHNANLFQKFVFENCGFILILLFAPLLHFSLVIKFGFHKNRC